MADLEPRLEIWRALLYGQRSMMLRVTHDLKHDFGLTAAQFEALHNLLEAPGHELAASRLADLLLYSSGSTTHLVRRLEELGWVTRRACDEDARKVLISLTDDGLDRIRRATLAHQETLREEFSPLIGDDDVAVLLDFARRLARHEGVSPAPPPGTLPDEAL